MSSAADLPQEIALDKSLPVSIWQYIGTRKEQEDTAGCARLNQEGAFVVVVADGMGGHDDGREASQAVVRSYIHNIKELAAQEPLKTADDAANLAGSALDKANRYLARLKSESKIKSNAGCTFTSIVFFLQEDDNVAAYFISVGDSYIFRLSPDGASFELVNKLHTLRHQLIEKGESLDGYEKKKLVALTSAVSGRPFKKDPVRPGRTLISHGFLGSISEADVFILSSDGLDSFATGASFCDSEFPEQNLAAALSEFYDSFSTASRRDLVAALVQNVSNLVNCGKLSSQDNTTVAMVRFSDDSMALPLPAELLTPVSEPPRKSHSVPSVPSSNHEAFYKKLCIVLLSICLVLLVSVVCMLPYVFEERRPAPPALVEHVDDTQDKKSSNKKIEKGESSIDKGVAESQPTVKDAINRINREAGGVNEIIQDKDVNEVKRFIKNERFQKALAGVLQQFLMPANWTKDKMEARAVCLRKNDIDKMQWLRQCMPKMDMGALVEAWQIEMQHTVTEENISRLGKLIELLNLANKDVNTTELEGVRVKAVKTREQGSKLYKALDKNDLDEVVNLLMLKEDANYPTIFGFSFEKIHDNNFKLDVDETSYQVVKEAGNVVRILHNGVSQENQTLLKLLNEKMGVYTTSESEKK